MGKDPSRKPTVLVASGDVELCLFLDHILQSEGFSSTHAADLEETLRICEELKPDAILLDCKLGSFSDRKTCGRLRRDLTTKNIPVIALISAGAEWDHVHLLKAGIEASFSRPIVPANLLEHLRVLLDSDRRDEAGGIVAYADIEMNTVTYQVRRNGRSVRLSPTEFKLLRRFLLRPEQVISRDELRAAAWTDAAYVGPRTIDVHVGRLRKALKSPCGSDLIRTVRSVGYALSEKDLSDAQWERP